jgi:hypothetical protein
MYAIHRNLEPCREAVETIIAKYPDLEPDARLDPLRFACAANNLPCEGVTDEQYQALYEYGARRIDR